MVHGRSASGQVTAGQVPAGQMTSDDQRGRWAGVCIACLEHDQR